jgi:hypothetical protein
MGESVRQFREQYWQQFIGPTYSGPGHFAFTASFSLAIIVLCAWQLENVQPLEWLTIPLTFLYSNFAEYFGHRGPMHHPRPGLGAVFKRHTRQHHRFFTQENMQFDSPRDYKAVLFPPVLVMFFLLAFGTPMALLLAWLTTANVGWLFAITGTAYFLNYELLHFTYHTPADSWVARLPGVAVLRRHHTLHHDQSLMSDYHFNITYPIADWVMGTLHRPRPTPRAEAKT